MIKRFCDRCGNEMVESATSRRVMNADKRGPRSFSVEVIAAVDGVSNSGDLCPGCVKDLVMKAPMGSAKLATIETAEAISEPQKAEAS